jgi:hypothetical protein
MNPVQRFIHQNKVFSLSILLNAFFRLSILQMTQGSVSFSDVQSTIELVSTEKLSTEDTLVYSGVVYETALIPCLLDEGPKLCIKQEIIGKEKEYLERLMQKIAVYSVKYNSNRSVLPSLQSLKQDINKALGREVYEDHTMSVSSTSAQSSIAISPAIVSTNGEFSSSTDNQKYESLYKWLEKEDLSSSLPVYISGTTGILNEEDSQNDRWNNNTITEVLGSSEVRTLPSGTQVQLSEVSSPHNDPINKLIAHIRKSGMDILAPQVIHDKVS